MPSSQTLHPRSNHPRLNKPPMQTRERVPFNEPMKPLQTGFHSSMNFESRSSNTTCDTTTEDSFCGGPREVSNPSGFNLSYYMEPVTENAEAKGGILISSYEEGYKVLNSAMQSKRRTQTDETKYKTEMCKKWSETGQCPYGRKCKFAHGRHELNEKFLTNKSAYKSKKCGPFHNQMICPYGIRCMFAHEQRSFEELLMGGEYRKFVSCPELLESPSMHKKRLPVFTALVSQDQGQEHDEIFNRDETLQPRNICRELDFDGDSRSFASNFSSDAPSSQVSSLQFLL